MFDLRAVMSALNNALFNTFCGTLNDTEFSCEESQSAEVFSGKIVKITNNIIEVNTKHGEEYTVHLGGCTKL